MQENDFIIVNYTGKVKETNKEFDKADNAPMIIKTGFVLKGLEQPLRLMKLGEKKTIEVNSENAFGKRDFKLIKLVPLGEFRKHGTKPVPGMFVEADNRRGKVVSVSGGRVRVDFNHPLAGKTLLYNIEIKKKIETPEDKIKTLVQIYTKVDKAKLNVIIKEKQVDIDVPPMINSLFKKRISDDIMKIMGMEKVRFIETFEKPKQETEKPKEEVKK
ncbi:MAG: FKBP-type peptidyl-prolyl cis-trans isomerase [Candidatus Aenigmatarchaeota archaeon]